jgi:hypothetical protein
MVFDAGTNTGDGDKPDKDSPWKLDSKGEKVRNTRLLPFETKLRELFVALEGAVTIGGDKFVATAIANKRDELAYGYAKLAKENSSVKKVLETLFATSAWAEALIPTLGLAIVVGWHYGMVPDQLGVPMTMAQGMVPESREDEVINRKRTAEAVAAAMQREAEEAKKPHSDSDD